MSVKQSMRTVYLPKKGGARFKDVDTFKVVCENNDIIGINTLKAADEVGQGVNEFTHVLLSHLGQTQREVIVKMHDGQSRFIKHELKLLNRLQSFRNCVKLICDFSCKDDKNRWNKRITKPTTLCQTNANDHVHFLIMEYIKDGDLNEFIDHIVKLYTSDPKQGMKLFKSLFLQISLGIMEMGTTYKIYHGDLNSGNILVYKTTQQIITYKVLDREYRMKTYGFYPVFIDFGRGGMYEKRPKNQTLIKEDISIIGNVLSAWIKDLDLSQKFNTLLDDIEASRILTLDDVVKKIKRL